MPGFRLLLQRFLFVSKMDSNRDSNEHESSVKRIKLDLTESTVGEVYSRVCFTRISTSVDTEIDTFEGTSADCDSGYEASTVESVLTPSQYASPTRDPGDVQENLSVLSGSLQQSPTHPDNLDASQDSIYVDDDDDASTISHFSELSGLSDLSGQDWKPMAGSMIWIQKQMQNGVDPRKLLSELGVDHEQIPQFVDEVTLWKLIINMLAEPPRRNKLRHINTLEDVVRLLKGAQNIIVLTGAGVSVSCGIPDFRSRDGIYSRLAIDFPDLPDPQAMFDISYFNQDPRPFFKFARDIYPGKFKPSPCHRFIKLLEKHKKLLRNYTQNIDTLEKVAEIERVVECHGSFATATCTKCGHKVTADAIRETVLSQNIPVCKKCQLDRGSSLHCDPQNETKDLKELVASGIMKPDIVFFGEGLPDVFHEAMADDKSKCDLLLVIGSSLKVRPVALIPSSLPSEVPQILINREPLPHCHFDVELLGDCDAIINHLCQLLGSMWEEGVYNQERLKEVDQLLPLRESSRTHDETKSCATEDLTRMESCDETEPKCTVYEKLNIKRQENICNCIFSTKSSSLSVEKDLKSLCTCNMDYDKQMSIINKQSINEKKTKERHMSVDSARDSGIGENSNFTDVELPEASDNQKTEDRKDTDGFDDLNEISISHECSKADVPDMRGYWQPKIKRSLADRLPRESFYFMHPSRYLFPGAEVFYDPDEKLSYAEDSESDSSGESDDGSPEAEF